jgi:enterobactin synthetase component D
MQTQLSSFVFPGTAQRVVRVDFDADTFKPGDLLWLPHACRLEKAVNKRGAEHLAGRIAAREALRLSGVNEYIPGIGLHRAPCWPPGFTGSITHIDKIALATVIAHVPDKQSGTGIDCEIILNADDAQDIAEGVINAAEREYLLNSPLPFPFALTLAFSAKESLFKALYPHVGRYFDFLSAEITEIADGQMTLRLLEKLGPFPAGLSFTGCWIGDAERLTTLIRFEKE